MVNLFNDPTPVKVLLWVVIRILVVGGGVRRVDSVPVSGGELL